MLVKSNQELHERIVEHDAQIADLEGANDAEQRRIDELEERVNALVARMEAVENDFFLTQSVSDGHSLRGMLESDPKPEESHKLPVPQTT